MMFDEHVHRTMLLGHWMDNGAGLITPCARAAEFPSNMAQRVNKKSDARRRHDTVDLAFMTQTSDSGLVCGGRLDLLVRDGPRLRWAETGPAGSFWPCVSGVFQAAG